MAFSLTEIQSILSHLTLPLYILVAVAFYQRGLWRSYRYFWIGIILEGLAMLLTFLTAGVRGAGKTIYLVAQPVMCVLYVLMVLEVFRKVFARFPGIARLAQRFIVISMVVALVLAFASTSGESTRTWAAMTIVQVYSVGTRAITSALCLYLILIAAFLAWMPVPLARNVIRHSVLFFVYFIATSSVYYVLNINDKPFVQKANLLISIITVSALAAWFFLLKPHGETDPRGPAAPRTPASAMLNRLESINKTLSNRGSDREE